MSLKMNLKIVSKNHAAAPEIGVSQNRLKSRLTAQRPCRQLESLIFLDLKLRFLTD